MSAEQMLQMLKIDLGLTADKYDDRLSQYLISSQEQIEKEGVTLTPSASITDANLIIQFAAWQWRKRDTGEGMPRMLRWQINNRLFTME